MQLPTDYKHGCVELQRRYHSFHINQINVLLHAMGRYPDKSSLAALLGQNRLAERVLTSMKKAVVLGSVRIKNLFKALRL